MSAWYERFFDGLYGRVLARQFGAETSLKQSRVIRRLLGARRGQRVLDVPCGQGRITLPLARSGLVMTGVDRTAAYLGKARRLARRGRRKVRFLQGDMREIAFDGEFDAAFNWFGSFGYFSDADNLEFGRRVFRALKPGGRFLVEGTNRSWLLTHFRPRSQQRIGGVWVAQCSRLNRRRTRIMTTWTLKRGTAAERHRIGMRLFNGAEIRKLLRAAGFREVRLYGRGGSRFTRHSRRLIAVARKDRR
jgi:ubiquinone/menaquinone biosynthesis C-methylase UbiE